MSRQAATMIYGGGSSEAVSGDSSDGAPPMAAMDAPDPALPVIPPAPDLTGTLLLDRYCLLRKLGVGGMGTVYEAEHVTIKKRCAIKILNPEFAHRSELVERFLQEARAASMIGHENVVEITDFGATPTGSVFFVMEMLVGEDLSETIKRSAPLPWSRVAGITMQICRALQAAHDKGIIHRDMKPENCFRIERSGNPDFIKVLDFGIAKLTGEDGSSGRLTSTGMIFGTPTYMSPEQAQGERVDHRADVYAVGVILYELVTGKVPFTADNFMGILTKHMFEDPPAPSEVAPEAGILPEVEALILKAMQKDRGLRFQSLRELMEAIQDVGTDAAPVVVVPNRVSRPNTGPTQFRPRTAPITLPTVETPARRRSGVFGVALAVAAMLGGSAVALYGMGAAEATEQPVQKDTPEPTQQVVVAKPPPIETPTKVDTPPVKPPDPPAAPAPVRVVLTTNTPAEVFDAAGTQRLGMSGDVGVALVGAGPHKLLLRAAQHEDLLVELKEPTEGQRFEYTLKPRAKKSNVAKTTKPPKDPGESKKPVETTPPPADNPGSGTKFGLKDPFKKMGG
ncbi:serine/threonine protein kinase [Nannocystis punicea]|uniref:Serine/threonine-protein kinase n=1 Tax=Nannocystis punicea TaxID=2995304 RepID=A0ABY7HII6_9BACT|nr:serine/threonine-protein kinase [Nannocystis poenicansa]WAS99134.1 serine/threonine-protein kinase [Nannocystis poenicansa]